MRTPRVAGRAVALVAVSLVLLGGCSNEPEFGSDSPSPGGAVADRAQSPGFAPSPAQAESVTTERSEVVTGRLALAADDPIETSRAVTTVVESYDGRVDQRSEQPGTDDSDPSASLTVRIPADRIDPALDEISATGEVVDVSISREDVTLQVQDLEARIAALQATVDRLRELIGQATSTQDLITAETALSERQGELDSLLARQRYLGDQVAMASITVSISTPDDAPRDDRGFVAGLKSGWDALLGAGAALVTFAGAVIPWVVFFAVAGAVGYGAVRLVRVARRDRRAES
ncbi:DUF4349 domain-containing protein [Rhodococcus triatomae]|uniref:DUF4349 domain-containing protein n=1 Tax=Rhodococcus triatomae TaxID=300028 RepID=A0A1G8Q200_9NOCA|nr:DUF4349 domain-containing protein [Rhodococcus triatomae]QNG19204.1 DUF4349 domain-containing protein [Rhodococcus triatomae]QNG24885.1 DUF4349 domain-containing protein [Rhodococcus triatomae]SDI98753.1 protein of unknown function [Rhodococcus triatomae]